ncbi:unnamed protein product [Ostreobium quekettii]|uniref:Uncharacterized protein n=1 Tax=Ostreobium quekettii TaxID=121088 RepID=A0A8S1IZN1_9CHLO|nr:unnamed protein product [Ostreobium quekettii]
MPRFFVGALLAVAASALAVAAQDVICPPEGFTANNRLDVRRFAIAPWYAQLQVPLSYQPVDQLFCVRARYELENPENISEFTLPARFKYLFPIHPEELADTHLGCLFRLGLRALF